MSTGSQMGSISDDGCGSGAVGAAASEDGPRGTGWGVGGGAASRSTTQGRRRAVPAVASVELLLNSERAERDREGASEGDRRRGLGFFSLLLSMGARWRACKRARVSEGATRPAALAHSQP
jgi:hypothetical protein